MDKTTRPVRLAAFAVAALLLLAACSKSPSAGVSGGGGGSTASASTGGGGYGSGRSYGSGGGGGSGGGASQTSGGGPSVLTVDQNNFSFGPAKITVKSGDTITVKNANASTPHTFTIKGTSIDLTNDPLQSQAVKIDLPPGTYQFYCRFHVQLGMKGTITIK